MTEAMGLYVPEKGSGKQMIALYSRKTQTVVETREEKYQNANKCDRFNYLYLFNDVTMLAIESNSLFKTPTEIKTQVQLHSVKTITY